MLRFKKVPESLSNACSASCSLDFIFFTDLLVYGTRKTWLMWSQPAALFTTLSLRISEVQGGTRNIATLDDTALPSDVHRVEDHQGTYERAQFWRGNADMVEDAGQHMALKYALADCMWDTHGNVYEPT
jgi:hypothetical protein